VASLTILTFLWGTKYPPADVAKLAAGVRRHLKQPHRFVVVTDDVAGAGIEAMVGSKVHSAWPILDVDKHLLNVAGCFVRLRMFDPTWQAAHGIGRDDRLVCMDLDSVVTGPLDALFDRPESFVILQGANASNPCPFNGSLMLLRGGAHPEVWSEFSIDAAGKVPFHCFPDDQGWLAAKVPDAAAWYAGAESGVYAFQKPGWPKGEALPSDARLVVFPGWRSPNKFKSLPWVKENWRQ
jgi:hypothetical protein